MIKVKSITIKEFRGIRDLTIKLNGNNFAVCGPNGTGKSGLIDALEFVLTGNISRLSGEGTGVVSVKKHAPHVDSRDEPEKASVTLVVYIPSLNKEATIIRNVKNIDTPIITPNDSEVIDIFKKISAHPEFVLSRRELIRYVISTPGKRAEEVQALLRLEQVENLRSIFYKIANESKKGIEPLNLEKKIATDRLTRALGITQLNSEGLLTAVNERRSLLGLNPITTLTSTTSLKDGLTTSTETTNKTKISKAQALVDLKEFYSIVEEIKSENSKKLLEDIVEKIKIISGEESFMKDISRERLLKNALNLVDKEECPVCNKPWNSAELISHIKDELKQFENATKKREEIEKQLEPFIFLDKRLENILLAITNYCKIMSATSEGEQLNKFGIGLTSRRKKLESFLPISDTLDILINFSDIPSETSKSILKIDSVIQAIPDQTKQDIARDYLTVSQERLAVYREASLKLKRAEDKAIFTKKVYDIYATVSNKILENTYKQVESKFTELYRFINKSDEGHFETQLIPSMGKLGFKVNFYGRGFFPPGAYHSEGHQDGMGLCLYLALMEHLSGDSFTFTALDDVLMSIDSGHRKEVCNLLKTRFPNTQFVLTTHDPTWLKHMKTIGLIEPNNFREFRKWDVNFGPIDWTEHDVWKEINDYVESNNITEASALLRNYLEYISAEICGSLRARVEYRGDAQYSLGDLLPNATSTFSKLIKSATNTANSYNKDDAVKTLEELGKKFDEAVKKANIEQWQINKAIHFNPWVNLSQNEFKSVIVTHRGLIDLFFCHECKGIFKIVPSFGKAELVKCECSSFNLPK